MLPHADWVIKGAFVVTPSGSAQADVAISAGRIAALGDCSGFAVSQQFDATGLHLLAGVIDSQVHFRDPGLTHKEDLSTGSRAAVLGGVTTYFEEPNTNPTTTTDTALEEKIQRASEVSYANFAFWVGASMDNLDELGGLELLPGTPGIGEVFMGSSTGPLLVWDDDSLRKVLQNTRRRVSIHAEDEPRLIERRVIRDSATHASEHPNWRDVTSSVLATQRILKLARETESAVHILHVSTGDEVEILRESKAAGEPTTCEITPQHLWFCSEDYERLDTLIQMNTPIRSAEHRAALRQGVSDGVFDVFGSDHAPHTLQEKLAGYPKSPSGMPGVQTMLLIVLELVNLGILSLERATAMLSVNPAKLFGVVGKGRIEEGYDADLVLVDLNKPFTITNDWIASKCGWTPYHGVTVSSSVHSTFVNGELVVREGELVSDPCGRVVQFKF